MSDFLLDAVAQFLKGDQWLEPVNAFMSTHKLAFVGISGPQEGYTLQHNAIFLEFKDMAERLLEGIIQDLGCDAAAFVAALEEAVTNEAGGPKEEETQALVKTLLAYDDFHGFCTLMQNYIEWNAVPSMPPDDNAAREDDGDHSGYPFDPKTYFASNEWILQEVVAQSLLEAQETGELAADDAAYLSWATAIMDMKAYYAAELEGGSATPLSDAVQVDDQVNPMASKVKELQMNLMRERLKVDLLVAQRISERNAGMRLQMSALCSRSFNDAAAADDYYYDQQAAMTVEEELCALCNRMEEVQTELKAVKKRCLAFKSISSQHMDEMYTLRLSVSFLLPMLLRSYLFLKEKIHFKYDLAQCDAEIAEFIFSRISTQDSPIVPDLLQWLLLESEAHEAQVEIQTRSFASPRAEAKEDNVYDRWVQQWSDEEKAYYYTNAVTGVSQWEPPLSKDGEPILGYWGDDNEWHPYAFLTPGEQRDAAAESKDTLCQGYDSGTLPPVWVPSPELKEIGSALESTTARDFSIADMSMLDVESTLKKVLLEHADESKKLEVALQVEHARQTQEIQRRKAQRRKERKMKKAAAAVADDKAGAKETPPQPLVAPPPPVELSGLSGLSGCQINICLPEGGKFDLRTLLSEADDRVRRERRGDGTKETSTAPVSSLNATSLRYLAEKIAPTSKLIEIEEI
ncbi:Aste57867_12323 [Aphanomyces stellatus]|uniref:Cilia- and flagella-associated protein 36 n=1 Tax=Aphanomyces stellatus TaxID=120398 RepID=A0A485KVQ3_9STRA|nr:hypothetical protein As57867_012277 [Aphanomyces stellatus]VFT89175.1 Aste57867_12323 [Aphanomyces stellatus]